MGAGSFLSGALGGYTEQAGTMKKAGKRGLLRRKKKLKGPSDYPPSPDQPGGGFDPSGPSYKRGGRVRKTGFAKLHKGERVIPAKRGRKRSTGKGR